ncbi:MAG: four helix bundle protein [Candidatus Gastranaerophilales bacterium]|nr:four helix bundle protein [Candidatus Gastranaerophilales bacterium]
MYKDLKIWNSSILLIKKVYIYADKLPKSEEYNLKSQLKRAIISVSLNIAEGKDRKTARDFAHFLNIASASLAEVEGILLICQELDFFKIDENILLEIETLDKMINSLYKKLIEKSAS